MKNSFSKHTTVGKCHFGMKMVAKMRCNYSKTDWYIILCVMDVYGAIGGKVVSGC